MSNQYHNQNASDNREAKSAPDKHTPKPVGLVTLNFDQVPHAFKSELKQKVQDPK